MQMILENDRAVRVNETNYISHLFVIKESSTTTRLTVVFDSSAKTSNGLSLNDNL